MSIDICESCPSCGGKCDKCSLACCINNMEKHKEVYKLAYDFNNIMYNVKQNLKEKCYEIKEKLYNNYGIDIEINNIYDEVLQSNNFLKNMELKKEELENDIDNINNEIKKIKKEKKEKIYNLNNNHENKITEINNIYNNEKKKYLINSSKYDNEFKLKKEKINELINEKNNIYIDVDSIVESIIKKERIKEENKFEMDKNEINNKYAYIESQLSYNQDELKLKNDCLNEIRKICDYSEKIPNFYNWINLYNLNKYIK